MEENEINLENPIFVYYFDSKSLSLQRASEYYAALSEKMSKYTNITFWIVPTDFTKIECVFDGWKSNIYSLKKLSDCLETIVTDPSLSEFKQKMREILIGDILNGKQQEKGGYHI